MDADDGSEKQHGCDHERNARRKEEKEKKEMLDCLVKFPHPRIVVFARTNSGFAIGVDADTHDLNVGGRGGATRKFALDSEQFCIFRYVGAEVDGNGLIQSNVGRVFWKEIVKCVRGQTFRFQIFVKNLFRDLVLFAGHTEALKRVGDERFVARKTDLHFCTVFWKATETGKRTTKIVHDKDGPVLNKHDDGKTRVGHDLKGVFGV